MGDIWWGEHGGGGASATVCPRQAILSFLPAFLLIVLESVSRLSFMSRLLPICSLVALALFPSVCLGWSLFTRTGKDCERTYANTISILVFSLHFVALCLAEASLQSAITPVGFNGCKSVPQTNPGNTGPLPNLGTSCCSLMDSAKPLYGVVQSASGICTGGRLVPHPLIE